MTPDQHLIADLTARLAQLERVFLNHAHKGSEVDRTKVLTDIKTRGELDLTAGGVVNIQSGKDDFSSDGATVFIRSGNGQTVGGDGGQIDLITGSAQGNNDDGGDFYVVTGNGNGTGRRGNVSLNGTDINTTDNGGFVIIPQCQGVPTGTPNLNGSLVYDRTNNDLYVYNSG